MKFIVRVKRESDILHQFPMVKIIKRDNLYFLTPVSSHGSADIIALSKADGFMVVDGKSSSIKKYAKLRFITWKTI